MMAASNQAVFRVAPQVLKALKHLGFTKPTPIQATVAATLKDDPHRKPLIVGAETGSGKTLAYAVPMMDDLLQSQGSCGLVVTPGKELCQQVAQVCTAMSECVGLRTAQMYAYDTVQQLGSPNVIVTTDSVLKTVDLEPLQEHLRFLVIDEFDAVFNGAESSHLWSLIRTLAPGALKLSYLQRQRLLKLGMDPENEQEHRPRPQLIMTGATLPDRGTKSTMTTVCSRLAPHLLVSTPKLHMPVDRLVQLFDFASVMRETPPAPRPIVNTTPLVSALNSTLRDAWAQREKGVTGAGGQQEQDEETEPASAGDGGAETQQEEIGQNHKHDDKYTRVCAYVADAVKQDASVLIFNNTVNNATELFEFLQKQLPPGAIELFHKKIPPRQRASILESFRKGDVKVLCCTDLLARGIDLDVDLILQADFAQDVVSYLHRIGRTARNGKHGCAVSLVDDSSLPLAQEIAAQVDSKRAQQWHAWRVSQEGKVADSASGAHNTSRDASLSTLFSRNRSARKRRKRAQQQQPQEGGAGTKKQGGGVSKKTAMRGG